MFSSLVYCVYAGLVEDPNWFIFDCMQWVAKQTYLYLAFEAAADQLGINGRRTKLSSVLCRLIQDNLNEIVDAQNKVSKKFKNRLRATMVLDSEYPLAKTGHQKLQAVLFAISPMITGCDEEAQEGDIVLMELYSQAKTCNKRQGKLEKSEKKEESEEDNKLKRSIDYKLSSHCTKKRKGQ